ncbi:galactose mutarotase-like enzyme [Evansella vedderi]|uniref:Galactose mutarotase-like enzyme n=1 Tax=Evansella vedderi TaxID=38282 RepID=A0ABU0A0H2_9BACI|nr:hypothetical protein [Evansella vedderi]MDQ0256715.1 galactose mutarotase-like enzyme [Evansella vedderi]
MKTLIPQLSHFYLRDEAANTQVRITPEKGGMITGFSLNGAEYLYIDEGNLLSDERPKSAMPILFPICGPLADDRLYLKGRYYPMEIHGIAHIQPWKVTSLDEINNELVVELISNNETKKAFPYEFSLKFTYRLSGRTLTVQQEYENLSKETMPFNYGFHPYFQMSTLEQLIFYIDAQTYFSLEDNQMKGLDGNVVMPAGSPSSLFLSGMKSPASFEDKTTGRKVSLHFDSNFKHLVLWSIPEKEFICLEPWNGSFNELNLGGGLKLQPGEVHKAELSITIE